MTRYDYTIATQTAHAACNPTKLQTEILASALAGTFQYITTGDGTVSLWFSAAVNTTTLTAIVAAHDGRPSAMTVGGMYSYTSPDGSIWEVTIDDQGILTTTKVS